MRAGSDRASPSTRFGTRRPLTSASGSSHRAIGPQCSVNTAATGKPAITGAAQVGKTLSAGTSGIVDADGLPEQFLFKANLPNVQLSTAIERQRQSYYWELNKYGRDHQGNNISGWIDWFTTLVYKAIVREMVAEQEIEY